MRYKAEIFYDGTDFCGWQKQNSERTVQACLEETMSRVFNETIVLNASGRTDSGVHARGQVVHFDVCAKIPVEKIAIAVNSRLAKDVRILSVNHVSEDFHARHNAKLRIYEYQIMNTFSSNPIDERYSLRVDKELSIKKLNSMAKHLTGYHDFTTFCAVGDASPHKNRLITSAVFYYKGPYIVFRIAGTAFLWRMVRSLVGRFLEWVNDDEPEQRLLLALDQKDRNFAGPTATPKGLFLHRVLYHEQFSI